MSSLKYLDCQSKSKTSSEFPKTIKSAFENRMLTLSCKNTYAECLLLEVFLSETLPSLRSEVVSFLKKHVAAKFNIELHAIFTKPNMKEFDNNWLKPKIFKTAMQECFYAEDFVEKFFMQVKILKQTTEEFQSKEGGWTLLKLVKIDFNVCKYQPLKGASYLPLPKKLVAKQACINVKNQKDNYCFKWALLSALASGIPYVNRPLAYKVDIKSKVIKLKDFCLNFEGLKFPLQIMDASIFEKNNPTISLNIFGFDEVNDLVIGPYYKTKKIKTHHINLLYIEGIVKGKTVGHYVWIKRMGRLIATQVTTNHGKTLFCDACLQHFSKNTFEIHIPKCGKKLQDVLYHEKCALKFRNSVKVVDVPFVTYAKMKEFPQNIETGKPLSYILMYFIKCSYDNDLNKLRFFKGPDAPRQFAESLMKDAKYYYKNYSKAIKPKMPLTDEENLEYKANENCCLCSKKVPEDTKVKLHCRLTGKYKGPAHHACALNYKIPKKFPVIFQNLSIDESQLLIKQLINIDGGPINVRTMNNELFICFEKDIRIEIGKLELRFLNFSMFLSCGLESLVEDISLADFKSLKSTYPDDSKFNMIFSKMLFPYKYLNCIEQLEEECLPSIDHFYDSIINEECSPENYANALKLWSEFKCETLEDYLKVCLEIDILLLTDVFENFRLVCRNAYNLDPCHYYSAAEFSWDAMLKITDVKLKLPPDEDMHAFIEKGMRVGISKCFQRHSLANNKYLSHHDRYEYPSKYLMSFHANDLYGRVMTELLPEGNFEWETVSNFSINSIPIDSDIGYILEVDLEYPSDIFETHKILPFCSENVESSETGEKKLVLRITDKLNYIIYYQNLLQCLKHGLKLKKIHRILKFKQSNWLKQYITLNKVLKSNKNSFQDKVLKLMNTAIYEKIMEKSVKRMKVLEKWESDGLKKGARAYVVMADFSSVKIIDENLVGVEFCTNIYNHVPVYLEFIISELVKLKMYNFHYEYIMPKYTKNVQLNYIDTDSLIYTITTEDLYSDIKNDILSMINPTGCNNNFRLLLQTLGMMKDANDGVVLKEFIGFRSKLYTLKTETMKEENKDCFSINNILNSISLFDYTNLLYKNEFNCDSIDSFKLKLYECYFKLLNYDLPLDYLDEMSFVLNNEIIENLGRFYYQNNFKDEHMDVD